MNKYLAISVFVSVLLTGCDDNSEVGLNPNATDECKLAEKDPTLENIKLCKDSVKIALDQASEFVEKDTKPDL